MSSAHTGSEKYFFLVMCVMGACAILSSTMSKNPVLNPFAESLGTPEAFMGFVAAASTIPGVLISLPAGSLSDVFGRKKVLLASTIIFASAPFLYVIITSWWQLVLVRFYHGFATAIFIPVARAALAEHYPSQKGEKISIFTSATIVGRSIAPFLGGFILSITIWNYSTLYLAVGVAGISTLFATLVFFKEEDKTAEEHPVGTSFKRFRESESVRGWKAVLLNLNILVVSSTEAAARYVYGALEFFLVGYLKNVAKLDPSLIGTIMGMQTVLIPVISPFMGRLSDKIGRKILILAGLTISGLVLIALPFAAGFAAYLAISVIYGLGFSMVLSSTPALVSDLTTKESYGAAMGFLGTVMDVEQMLGPIITGFILATFGYSNSFFSLGATLLGVCALFALHQKMAGKPA